MGTRPRLVRLALIVCLLSCGILISATSTARIGDQIVEADHRKIVDELKALINDENYRQNLEIMSLRERQNTNIERIKVLEDRFWTILIGILGSFVTSALAAIFSFQARKQNEPWDGMAERRRSHLRRLPPEND